MKTSIRFILAWALALMAFFAQPSFAASQKTAAFKISIDANSPRMRAYIGGDYGRSFSLLRIENVGDAAGIIQDVVFYTTGTSYLSVSVDDNYYQVDSFDAFYPGAKIATINRSVPAGKSLLVSIKGGVSQDVRGVFADIWFLTGSFTSQQRVGGPAPTHPVVDELPSEGLTNTSVRTTVSQNRFTAMGFVIKGEEGRTQQVLVRAVGPGLKPFGVQNVLSDPYLTVRDSSGAIVWNGENDNWRRELSWLFQQVGAFALPKDSLDSAVILYLSPGAYTAQVKGFGTGEGEVLIEAYQLPQQYGGKG